MRFVIAVVLLLVVAGLGALLWQWQGDAVSPLGATGGTRADGPGLERLPPRVVATRREQVAIEPDDVADQPTAWLRIVDHATGRPLAGAEVRLLRNGASISFADERGLAPVPLTRPTQLVAVHEGHLLRLAPTQVGSTEQSPQIVRMVADTYSIAREFSFEDEEGEVVDEVFARLHVVGSPAAMAVPQNDAVLQRAWNEHTMLAGREVAHDVAVQLGEYDADRVHHLTGDRSVIRFLAPGRYELEASAVNGSVGRLSFDVAAGPLPAVQVVTMRPGRAVQGRVTDRAAAAIAGAEIRIQGGDPLGLVATTAADGTFSIGPLSADTVTLLVRHGLHQPVAFGPVAAHASDVVVALDPLDRAPMRGRVRVRPDLTPLADATVIWQVAGGSSVTARTDANGDFELMTAGDIACRFVVQAAGHVTYAELVEPGAPFAHYDVWPAVPAVRVAKGITATLAGQVLDGAGVPLAGVSVRWRPDVRQGVPGTPGRRVLEGGALQLVGVATTDETGSFVIETDQFGAGRLTVGNDTDHAVAATAVAGTATTGLRLQR